MKQLDLYTLIRVREAWDLMVEAASYQGGAPVEAQFNEFIYKTIARAKQSLLTSGEEREA